MGSDNGREGIGPGDSNEALTEVVRPKTELEAKIGPVLDYFGDGVTPMQRATIYAICGRLNRERREFNLDVLARAIRYLGPVAFIAQHSGEEAQENPKPENTEAVGEIAETFRDITEKLRQTGSRTAPGATRKATEPDNRSVADIMEEERRRMEALLARNGGRRSSQTFQAPTSAQLAEARRNMEKNKAASKAGEEEAPKTEDKPGGLLASVRETLVGVQDALGIGKEK